MASLVGIFPPPKKEPEPKIQKTKNPTRENLVREIGLAEFDAVGYGKPGQVWYKPTGSGGELWTTHFSDGDNYLPSAASKNFILLYVATPKTLNEATGRNIADPPEEGRPPSAFYIEELKKYARGDYAHKFDPRALAEKAEKLKILPALAALRAKTGKAEKTGKTGAPSPLPVKEGGPSLLDICRDFELDAQGRVELDKATASALFAAADELAGLYGRLAVGAGVDKEKVDALYADVDLKSDRTKILEILEKARALFNEEGDAKFRGLMVDVLNLYGKLTDREEGLMSDDARDVLGFYRVDWWDELPSDKMLPALSKMRDALDRADDFSDSEPPSYNDTEADLMDDRARPD